jgi:HSP20 family protein
MEELMDRMWGDAFHPVHLTRRWTEPWNLPLDIYQTEDSVVVKASVPGIKPEDMEVTLEGNTLTLKGETKTEEVKEEGILLREHRYGSFFRSVTLPTGLDTDKAEASYENGVLILSIPKREEVKPKSIKVSVSKSVEGKKK